MQKQPLVSVIIPTYNRAHLIGQTLDSIIAQTYQNWECIVVDDGSSDHTNRIMQDYCQKDTRIYYHHRPEEHLSGGNGARNFGFKKSNGDFIIWFDSDDLMTDDHVEKKVQLVSSGNYDFGISRTRFFNHHNKVMDSFYQFDKYSITLENYVLQKINWLTLDVIIRKDLANKVRFDEYLKCSQEFNYYSKLLCLTNKTVFLNKVISWRRYGEQTTSQGVRKNSNCKLLSYWYTYIAVYDRLSLKTKKQTLLDIYKGIILIKEVPNEISKIKIAKHFFKVFKTKFFILLLYYFLNKVTSRFLFLRKMAFSED